MLFSEALLHILPTPFGYQGYNVLQIYTFFRRLLKCENNFRLTIPAPTLVIAGTEDMIKESHTRLIARSISGAELVILPGDHFVANKHPEAFNQAVLSFLR